jgi:VCBS repeat protein/FG-GAP repeat protein
MRTVGRGKPVATVVAAFGLALFFVGVAHAAAPGFVPAPGSPFATGGLTYSIATGDFNGDRAPDVAIGGAIRGGGTTSGKVWVLLGDGHGGLSLTPGSPTETGTPAESIALSDFNNDWKLDAIVTSRGSLGMSVLLGDGQGGLTIAAGSPGGSNPGPVAVATGDFNGDGNLDAAVANEDYPNANTVFVFLGDGQGRLTPAPGVPFAVGGSFAADIVSGDLNRDGMLDVAVANAFSDDVSIMLGDGQGALTEAPGSPVKTGGHAPGPIAIGDLDHDRQLDLVVGEASPSGNAAVLLGDGDGGFAPAAGSPFASGGNTPRDVVLADFDGDRHLDAALANQTGVGILAGDGRGGLTLGFGSPYASGGDFPFSLVAADFDLRGTPDVAVLNRFSADITVLLNTARRARPCEDGDERAVKRGGGWWKHRSGPKRARCDKRHGTP